MIKSMRRSVLSAALTIGVLSLAGPLAAQSGMAPVAATPVVAPSTGPSEAPAASPPAPKPKAPPTPEALRLARDIAHGYLAAVRADMVEQKVNLADYPVFQTAPLNTPALSERMESWIEVMREACLQTLDDRREKIEAVVTRGLAERFSEAELRAGAELIDGPGGRYVGKIYAHEQPRQAVPAMGSSKMANALTATLDLVIAKQHGPLPAEAEVALAKLKSTEAGRTFLAGALDTKSAMQAHIVEYMQIVMPPFLRHVGEGLEADQARHDAGAKDTPPPDALSLGVTAIHGFYSAVDEQAWNKASASADAIAAKTSDAGVKATGMPSDWRSKSARSMLDTIRYEQPTVERALGRALARLMTIEDLKVLAEFANSPVPPYFVRKASADGDASKAPPPPEVQAALEKFTKSGVTERLGAQFKDKDKKDKLIAIGIDAAQPILARWMVRFGKELEAPLTAAAH